MKRRRGKLSTSYKEQGKRVDVIIVVDEDLRKKRNIPLHIKYLVVEITADESEKKAIDTIKKNYHRKNTLLLHNPWSLGKKKKRKIKYKIPEDVAYKENILFLSGGRALRLFGLY